MPDLQHARFHGTELNWRKLVLRIILPTETRDGILKEIPEAYEDVDEVVEQRLSGARFQRS